MTHISETDLALYCTGRLDSAEARRVSEHLSDCGSCAEECEIVKEVISDLSRGRVRRLWPWRFRRLWKRVEQIERELEQCLIPAEPVAGDTTDIATPERVGINGTELPSLEPVIKGPLAESVMCAPGSLAEGLRPAEVYARDDQQQIGRVSVRTHFDTGASGKKVVCVSAYGLQKKLAEKTIKCRMSSSFEQFELGPSKLTMKTDDVGDRVEAHFEIGSGPLSSMGHGELSRLHCRITVLD